MPYKVVDGAIERAKYRAKLAVRDVAYPTEPTTRRVQWRWAGAVAVAAVVAIGVVGLVRFIDEAQEPVSPMEELFSEMQDAPDDIIKEWARDAAYYNEDVSSL